MMMVALIMRPWITIIMTTLGVVCWILADDLLIIAQGQRVLIIITRAINATHRYLQTMGARVAR